MNLAISEAYLTAAAVAHIIGSHIAGGEEEGVGLDDTHTNLDLSGAERLSRAVRAGLHRSLLCARRVRQYEGARHQGAVLFHRGFQLGMVD